MSSSVPKCFAVCTKLLFPPFTSSDTSCSKEVERNWKEIFLRIRGITDTSSNEMLSPWRRSTYLGGGIPSRPPWCGCHGNGRCLATAHWNVSSYERLDTTRMKQIRNSMTVTWPNIKILKIQDGGRPPYWKMLEMLQLAYQWWSHPTMSQIYPLSCSCHGNGHCLATAHWTFSSYGHGGRMREPILMKFCTQKQIWNLTTVTLRNASQRGMVGMEMWRNRRAG